MAEPGLRGPEGKRPGSGGIFGRRASEMRTSRQHRERSERALTVANSSVLRPPLVVLAALLLGAVLTVVWPLPFFLRILGQAVLGSRDAGAWEQADDCDCPHRSLSLQPEPDLSGVLLVAPRPCNLG